MRARDNPFATARVERVAFRLSESGWDELIDRFAKLNFRASLVGPKGSGKTTLLEEFDLRLQARGFQTVPLRLREEKRRFSVVELKEMAAQLTRSHMVLLDGAEQMPRLQWMRFKHLTRRAAGLLVTTHRPALLPTLWECRTTPGLLSDIVDDLLGGNSPVGGCDLDALFHRHQGNLREALRDLYDTYSANGT